ncbi:ABC transporter ATP-binding protein [Rhodopseudomonas palustris]|uniref:ABC transporter ATP-binding protein n=1 Tax=Rhodopseudomonas palustris (strain ATCC BAA-98 / CGA009) TaxID=258594 RepID=Q6N9Y7_RHOPA|nr:ABC transporter ATP-binding protein [Rhodopseudomonas palustris]PPQ43808.1 ABC transporter ATP-binding protein [Rhodopseudomonas palustris]QQM02896.1 sn-glycerol-3-phosphate import ATP-binding protein UgpC [Rhodopseudomonas palustris]RJF60479.1 ABC transporter ATP-binding protein [Rhodopseudomonas palustris]WAB79070.1 ABC transporter ATP-binding protein [Rhodopseudomonas palustris]WCL91534.1 ABC transporter ATP-binding protein [Rhodopseudomonas palustris CGA009]
MTLSALTVEGISKRFGKTYALSDVGFDVAEGELVVILGAAGAGKTTTLRTIAGLEVPDSGRIVVKGRDVTNLEPKDRNLAMIFDNLALYPNKSGFDNIAHPLRVRKQPPASIEARVTSVAATLRVSHVLNRLPATMSGGERQRVALGRALVREPDLFLLDEPLSSLDAMLRIELRSELKRMQREHGYAFLLATPDYVEALAIADRVVMLISGAVRQIAPPQVLYDDPVDRDVARFVGAPEINLLRADYDPAEGGRIRLADAILPLPPLQRQRLGDVGRSFQAGLRPEHIRLSAPDGATASVTDVEALGLQSVVTFETSGAVLRAVLPATEGRRLRIGDRVGLSVNLERMVGFESQSGRRIA